MVDVNEYKDKSKEKKNLLVVALVFDAGGCSEQMVLDADE